MNVDTYKKEKSGYPSSMEEPSSEIVQLRQLAQEADPDPDPDPTKTAMKRTAEDMLNDGTADNDVKRIRSNQPQDSNHDTNTSIDQTILSTNVPETTKDSTATAAGASSTNITKNPSPAVVEDITHNKSQTNSRGHMILSQSANPGGVKRWRSHRMAEDYISLCADMMFPSTHLAPFGYDAPSGQYPIESITALSILTSPLLRRPTVVEKWCPYEIAVFEAALALCGKHFHQVQKFVKTKNTKEVIEFYYVWKKTAHYKVWKKQYVAPEDDVDSDNDE